MTTKAGVGYSDNPYSRDAGVEAAGAALAEAGIETCGLAILYSTPKHDPSQLRDGIRAAIGPGASLIGGYAVGIITRNRLGYGGCEVGVAVCQRRSKISPKGGVKPESDPISLDTELA